MCIIAENIGLVLKYCIQHPLSDIVLNNMTKFASLIVSLILVGFILFFSWWSGLAASMGGGVLYKWLTYIFLISAVFFTIHAIKNFRSRP